MVLRPMYACQQDDRTLVVRAPAGKHHSNCRVLLDIMGWTRINSGKNGKHRVGLFPYRNQNQHRRRQSRSTTIVLPTRSSRSTSELTVDEMQERQSQCINHRTDISLSPVITRQRRSATDTETSTKTAPVSGEELDLAVLKYFKGAFVGYNSPSMPQNY